MATAIPGARYLFYLFSILQNVLVDQPTAARIRLHPLVVDSLNDWVTLANTLSTHPTPLRSLVPAPPDFVGAVDASGIGLGGFWTSTRDTSVPALVFRLPFPSHISSQLVSSSNPSGRLTNSDFELAALIVRSAVLAHHVPLNHNHIWCGSNNTAAVSWCAKGSPISLPPSLAGQPHPRPCICFAPYICSRQL
jgi:hypothetical protein